MTAKTSATVVSIGQPSYTRDSHGNTNSTCPLTVSYSVDGQQYENRTSSMSSSENCSLSAGQSIQISYNPENPGSWAYGAQTVKYLLQVFFWAGLLALISGVITFFIRLFSIVFGWKLLRDGRRNAAQLPAGTNLQTMIDEIKRNFTSSIFGFGNAQSSPVYSNSTGMPPVQNL